MKKAGIFVIIGLLATSTFALADTVPTDLDADKDGYISLKEAEAAPELMEQFSVLDVNKDGKVDMEELSLFSPDSK